MLTPSGSLLPPGGVITQEMRVVATSNVSYLMHIILLQALHAFLKYFYAIVGDVANATAHPVLARWPAASGTDGGQRVPGAKFVADRIELQLY